MSVTVFVWYPATGESKVGHAALAIESPKTYISWWPESAGLLAPSSPGVRMARISTDIRAEARLPDFASAPIGGLNEIAIARYWDSVRGTSVDYGPGGRQRKPNVLRPVGAAQQYNMYTFSCATVVLRCLEAGDLYSVYPQAKQHVRGLVVEPTDIRSLAELISGNSEDKSTLYSALEHVKRQVAPWF